MGRPALAVFVQVVLRKENAMTRCEKKTQWPVAVANNGTNVKTSDSAWTTHSNQEYKDWVSVKTEQDFLVSYNYLIHHDLLMLLALYLRGKHHGASKHHAPPFQGPACNIYFVTRYDTCSTHLVRASTMNRKKLRA